MDQNVIDIGHGFSIYYVYDHESRRYFFMGMKHFDEPVAGQWPAPEDLIAHFQCFLQGKLVSGKAYAYYSLTFTVVQKDKVAHLRLESASGDKYYYDKLTCIQITNKLMRILGRCDVLSRKLF